MRENRLDVASDGRVQLNPLILKRLRQKRGLSQDALAQLCLDSHLCLSLASIKRAEAGKSVSYRTARHLAGIYHTELDSMVAPSGSVALATTPAQSGNERSSRVRAPIRDRRRTLITEDVIFFTLKSNQFNDLAQKHVLDSGARTIAAPHGSELAIVFGAPAYRCTDAFAALRCAINLKSCVAPHSSLTLRRRAVAEVFTHAARADENLGQAAVDNSIYLETDLATQLSVLAQFEARDVPIPGCKRFLRLNC
jgi:transcriptional regulator with XRE-family HTH domain